MHVVVLSRRFSDNVEYMSWQLTHGQAFIFARTDWGVFPSRGPFCPNVTAWCYLLVVCVAWGRVCAEYLRFWVRDWIPVHQEPSRQLQRCVVAGSGVEVCACCM